MKRIFSRIMIMAMVLCSTSGVEGAFSVAGKAGIKAINGVSKKFGQKAATEAFEAAGKAGLKITTESLEGLIKASKSVASDIASGVIKSTDNAMDIAAGNLSKMQAFGVDFATASADDITKFASKNFDELSSTEFAKQLDETTMPGAQKNLVKFNFSSSKGVFAKSARGVTSSAGDLAEVGAKSLKTVAKQVDDLADDLAKKADDVADDVAQPRFSYTGGLYKKLKTSMGKGQKAIDDGLKSGNEKIRKAAQKAKDSQEILDNPSSTSQMRKNAARDLADAEYALANGPGKALRALAPAGKYAGITLMGLAVGMYGAVVFSLPTLLQSAFIAEQHEVAMFQTYIPPVKFGNIVMQLPDSVVDMTNPMNSQFVYYGIPVNNPGEKLSEQAKAAYPGVSNPTAKNKVSAGVENRFAQAFTLGATKKVSIPRYNLDAQALSNLPIFVSYTDQSWSEWGSNAIPDAAFMQTMINLNTGYIFYADGTSNGVAPAGLVAIPGGAKTVDVYMSKKEGLLKSAGTQVIYRDFNDLFSTSKAGDISSPLLDQFNCSCLDGGALTADVVQKCSGSKKSTCLLTKTLNQLAAGIVLNSQGQVLTPDQDLATEVANGALGQILPIQGYGNKFDDILRMFPGAEKEALANSGVLTISLGSNLDANTADIQGAPADNYAAKGVYVYQCKNTPFAKMLRSQAGGSVPASDYITDFIVFLDQDLNQVPLMAPMQDPKNYNFIKMDLNPAIKYFSTIIGSLDGNGAFNFLPQLNIQSPAALTAKGLPATFAPLYSLQATNGSLGINYNQNLSSAVGGMAQALLGHAKLGQQFKTMQTALLTLLNAGPFGKYQLKAVAEEMQPIIGGVELKMYTGFNSYPVSQDASNANCSDVLIPLSAAGKTVTLPSNAVTQYYGLVTDLTYSVRDDGTIAVDPQGFANSALSQDLTIDTKKVENFYWMDKLTTMGQSSDPEFAMPEALINFVVQARSAWIDWIDQHASNKATQQEFAGVKVAGTAMTLTIANEQALANGLYIYTATPCPSSQAQDYFVLVNSANPQANDPKLGSMSAASATATTNMLSIISGVLYNLATGQQVKNSAGGAYMVNSADVLKALNAKNPKALSDDFKAKLNISNGQAKIASQALLYPFNFGGVQLGIYQADVDAGIYLYVDAAGAGASANFTPADYFVMIDAPKNPSKVGTNLTASTAYMVSLVSGNVYVASGVQSVMDASALAKITGSLSASWRPGVAEQVAKAAASFAAMIQNQQKETAQMNAAPVANSGAVTFDQASVQKMIATLAGQSYLPAPYDTLKYDAASGDYVLITPANYEQTDFLYTFFDVDNSFVDSNGKPVRVGAIYDSKGALLRVLRGFELATMLRQYGVAVDATGNQYLGVQNALPILPLDPADRSLKPGVSGKSMIYSNDPQFPSFGITSPINYLNNKFYIYFNTMTQAYYAMQVTSSDVCYIDIAGGAVYNLDGSPRVATNLVSINKNNDLTDMLLPYANPDGFIRCFMKNSANNNMYSDFLNLSGNFELGNDPATNNFAGINALISLDAAATKVQVAQMPLDQDAATLPEVSQIQEYNVYVDGASVPVSYLASNMYTWQNLTLLPINMTNRAILQTMPDEKYNSVQFILKNKAPYAAVFAGQFYTITPAGGKDVYTLTSGTDKLTASVKMDTKTNLQYMEIVQGTATYNYQYLFMTLSEDKIQSYRAQAWQATIVPDATGKVVFAKSLPVDAAGNVQLSKVTISSVVNAPSQTGAKNALQTNLGAVMQDTVSGRFVTAISNGTYSYFEQDGYVDLENGILFDAAGAVLQGSLQFADLMNILNQLSVSVVRNDKKQAGLRYRPSAQVPAPVVVQAIEDEDMSNEQDAVVSATNQASARILGRLSSKVKTKAKSKRNRRK